MTTETQETRFADRSSWGHGPWDAEKDDRHEWRDAATGMTCLASRGPHGSWCGYVAVPPGHALHGVGYSDDAAAALEAHGGLTYSNKCAGRICHVPAPGEPDDVWWFGFDCAHGGDLTPRLRSWGDDGDIYRSIDYVRGWCGRLAAQLAEVGARR